MRFLGANFPEAKSALVLIFTAFACFSSSSPTTTPTPTTTKGAAAATKYLRRLPRFLGIAHLLQIQTRMALYICSLLLHQDAAYEPREVVIIQ